MSNLTKAVKNVSTQAAQPQTHHDHVRAVHQQRDHQVHQRDDHGHVVDGHEQLHAQLRDGAVEEDRREVVLLHQLELLRARVAVEGPEQAAQGQEHAEVYEVRLGKPKINLNSQGFKEMNCPIISKNIYF